jgi:hypothetical protein
MTVILLIVVVAFGVTGGLLVYGSLRPSERWSSNSERAVALLTGLSMVAIAAAFAAAAATRGGTRTDLLIVGGCAGLIGAIGRWFVRRHWEATASDSS